MELLLKWQRVHRLLGSAERPWIVANIFVDSLLFLRVLPPSAARVLDFGSGAGVPGIPVAIVAPGIELCLLEARQKRVSFLSEALRTLGLANCSLMPARAEAVADSLSEAFDAVMMRCAGPPKAAATALRFLRPGGVIIATSAPDTPPGNGVVEVSVPGLRPRRFRVSGKPVSSS